MALRLSLGLVSTVLHAGDFFFSFMMLGLGVCHWKTVCGLPLQEVGGPLTLGPAGVGMPGPRLLESPAAWGEGGSVAQL